MMGMRPRLTNQTPRGHLSLQTPDLRQVDILDQGELIRTLRTLASVISAALPRGNLPPRRRRPLQGDSISINLPQPRVALTSDPGRTTQ